MKDDGPSVLGGRSARATTLLSLDDWCCRHEARGPEQDAWLRALAQVDGHVFEGGPPPIGRETPFGVARNDT